LPCRLPVLFLHVHKSVHRTAWGVCWDTLVHTYKFKVLLEGVVHKEAGHARSSTDIAPFRILMHGHLTQLPHFGPQASVTPFLSQGCAPHGARNKAPTHCLGLAPSTARVPCAPDPTRELPTCARQALCQRQYLGLRKQEHQPSI